MSEKVELNKEDVEKAYQEGCPDVKKTLRTLFPWVEPKKENGWKEVPAEDLGVRLETLPDNTVTINLLHKGRAVISLLSDGDHHVREEGYKLKNKGYRWAVEHRTGAGEKRWAKRLNSTRNR